MKIVNIDQNSDVWFDFRRDKIGGSDSKGIKPLSRGSKKGEVDSAVGFWKFFANTYSVEKDGEDERARGHRTEAENLRLTNKKFGLDMKKSGVWVSDYSEFIHISPDGADESLENAFEGKAFDSHKHLSIIYYDLLNKKGDEYNPLDCIPPENIDQIVKYFAINEKLKNLYWSLINEFVAFDELAHYVIKIERKDVADLIEPQKEIELNAVKKRDEVIKFMLGELK